jgi:hypothetical protein
LVVFYRWNQLCFFTTILPNNGDPALATLDFSAIAAADNNANFKLKVEFAVGTGGPAGNNRFDNFTTEGALLAVEILCSSYHYACYGNCQCFYCRKPNNYFNKMFVWLIIPLLIIQMLMLIELRLNNASGTVVPFDATFATNTITIVPSLH